MQRNVIGLLKFVAYETRLIGAAIFPDLQDLDAGYVTAWE